MLDRLWSFLRAVFSPTAPPNSSAVAKPLTPLEPTDRLLEAEPSKGLAAQDIGFAVGAAGGTVEDAAMLQYVLSRVVPPGQKPTSDQVARIVGMLHGGFTEAVIINEILKESDDLLGNNASLSNVSPKVCDG